MAVAAAVVGALLQGAAAGAGMSPDPASFIGNATAAGLPALLEPLRQKVAAELSHRRSRITAAAVTASGLSEQTFCTRLAENPGLSALTIRVLTIAEQSTYMPKLIALGRSLGEAVANHGDKIDDTRLLVDALEVMEPPHVATLDALIKAEDSRTLQGSTDSRAVGSPNGSDEWMERVTGLPMDTIRACRAMLATVGVVDAASAYGGVLTHSVTARGRAIRDAIQAAGEGRP